MTRNMGTRATREEDGYFLAQHGCVLLDLALDPVVEISYEGTTSIRRSREAREII